MPDPLIIDLRDHATPRTAAVMQLLRCGVPVSLLMDLADPLGPDSIGILQNESSGPGATVIDLSCNRSVVAS